MVLEVTLKKCTSWFFTINRLLRCNGSTYTIKSVIIFKRTTLRIHYIFYQDYSMVINDFTQILKHGLGGYTEHWDITFLSILIKLETLET